MVAAHQSGEALRLPSLPTMYSACLGRVRVRVRVRVRIRVRVRVRIRVRRHCGGMLLLVQVGRSHA